MRGSLLITIVSVSVLLGEVASGGQSRSAQSGVTRLAIIQAEAARAAAPDQLQLLTTAATTPSPLQAIAVRAIGRLERPDQLPTLVPLLEAKEPRVRAEAANALAQSAGADPAAAQTVRERLMARLAQERDADVRGAIAESLGRLPVDSPAVAGETERALCDIATRYQLVARVDKSAAGGRIVGLAVTSDKEVAVPMPALLGALRGLESFARGRARAKQSLLPDTIFVLKMLALARPPEQGTSESTQRDAARVRRLAFLCLLPSNAADIETTARAQGDPDPQVRRLAMSSASASRETLATGDEGRVLAGAVRSAPTIRATLPGRRRVRANRRRDWRDSRPRVAAGRRPAWRPVPLRGPGSRDAAGPRGCARRRRLASAGARHRRIGEGGARARAADAGAVPPREAVADPHVCRCGGGAVRRRGRAPQARGRPA